MAELVLKDCYLVIGTTAAPTNLTDHLRSVTITYGAELQDKTAMMDEARTRIAGLKDFSIALEFNQDFAAASVDAVFFAMVGSTAKRVVIKPTTAIVGAANPRFTGSVVLESYSPIGGAVGDMGVAPVTLQGDGVLSRSTTTT